MFTKVRLRILYIFLLLTTYSINSNTHEFWIEPSQYQSKDSLITAHLRVGQEFQGMALMYNPKDFKSFKSNVMSTIGFIDVIIINLLSCSIKFKRL